MIDTNKAIILNEIKEILSSFNEKDEQIVVDMLAHAHKFNHKVLCYGAGRMGLSLKAFSMRLNHLGLESYYFGDNYIPPLDSNDILILVSNSGETTTVVSVAQAAAKKAHSQLISFVGNTNSALAKMSNVVVPFKTCNGGLNSNDDPNKFNSVQPMTTLTEQALFIEFDVLILGLIEKLNINLEDTKGFHSNVE